MKGVRQTQYGLTLLTAVVLGGKAEATEGLIPYLPGVTTGIPVGALPPPGLYVTNNSYVAYGKVEGNDGKKLPIKIANYSDSITAIWSSPYHILGAQYGAGIIQIAASHGVDARGVGGRNTRQVGAFNTIIQPIILSWKVGSDLFISTTQTVYIKDGDFTARNGVRDQTSYANNYWTYEPSVAISYLHHGIDLTANLLFDVNSKNKATNYHSGSTFYADLTASKTTGKLTYGVVGSVTQQTQDDHKDGLIVGDGNRVSHIMAGPMLSYPLGRFTLMARYLQDLRSRNDIGLSIGYFTIATRF